MEMKNPAADSGTLTSKEQAGTLFRQKSLETVESPEDLQDYLRVTSPGVWLVLAAVTMLLAGGLVWSVFGRVTTSIRTAVLVDKGNTVCLIPSEHLQEIPSLPSPWTVNVNGLDYALNTTAEPETILISTKTDPKILTAGNLEIGDVVFSFPVAPGLADGVYTGSVITESLSPLSLLLK